MAEKKPNIHKTILILLLVFIPPYWLMFTDEGARMSDTALLWLLGEDEIKFNLGELSNAFTRDDIQQAFPDITWQCGAHQSTFGDNLCAAQIGTFNGYPSRVLTLYFVGNNINALKLIYRDQYHQQLMGYYIKQFGQPSNVAAVLAEGPEADNILQWDLEHGRVLLKKELASLDEPALLWVALPGGAR